MKSLAIFASGSGTNAENIIRYFSNSEFLKSLSYYPINKEPGFTNGLKN
jgi:formyltetrahydrofolate-dependent phosphoribosylglycinamide formyltransferase (EC 2.1.2.2)